jgi:hypothetical protein
MKLKQIIPLLWLYSNLRIKVMSFTPLNNGGSRKSVLFQKLTPKEEEKMLRREIAERNSVVEDEEKYSLRDGEGMEGAFVNVEEVSLNVKKDSNFAAKMERMIKPRAYPLFLAEKAAELVEHAVEDIFKSSIQTSQIQSTKEKIVVLGTGWGAASFLKDIDTTQYDVIVISPRNYFLFTPMLAGSSVGTVEYRSITEPIREVSTHF